MSVVFFTKINPEAIEPTYANPGDAGADLHAIEECTLSPGERAPVRTGIAVQIPDGFAGLVLPRSGLARKHGITLANSPGLVDSGYRGELVCVVQNLGNDTYTVTAGDRIGQLMIVPFAHCDFLLVDQLATSARGEGGFGSTGR